jgi:hypothetical protein
MGHELTPMFSRAERALECGGLTPLSAEQEPQCGIMSDDEQTSKFQISRTLKC